MEDISKYAHSPAHTAVLNRDHVALRRIVSALPKLAKAGKVNTEAESLAAEADAEAVSAVIDRRDVPRRETPLHLCVQLHDTVSAEILMEAGADWRLQNENGWTAFEEAVCVDESIATIIARRKEPLSWAKWCRNLPRILASASRIHDFYMEITWNFESSVIPFIGRIAPSDTYRILKRGCNLRADMTLAGFDGFRIQRSDRTIMFLGEGYSSFDGKTSLSPGSLIVLAHKKKEITNALEGAGARPSEGEVRRQVALKKSQVNMSRSGIDVSQAELIPQLNWRRQEKSESVAGWKAKVYDMHHVQVSVKSRRVPGAAAAAPDGKQISSANDDYRLANLSDNDEYHDVLTAEERMQLDSVEENGLFEDDDADAHESFDPASFKSGGSIGSTKEKKSWLARNKKSTKIKLVPKEDKHKSNENRQLSTEFPPEDSGDNKKVKKKNKKGAAVDSKSDGKQKKPLRPVLWLTPDFPLKTDELLPFLDILSNQVKAVRRLREFLTTKFPPGTFPVKIAIPIVPTVRVLVTFTKFEELQASEEFSTPPSSPTQLHDEEAEGSRSWMSWMRSFRGSSSDGESHEVDPFHIPSDYLWVDANERRRRMETKKANAEKNQRERARKNSDGAQRYVKEVESQ
ncbi:uncharacterized protein LOC127256105 [Andrographis paniculata]|uniref:uncharacterized protein LOC127256105 n=1 Tax=Andrographis paniculata TaxID=175694 RepID=UPI0021E7B62A|nr:uncharacterized protein LOC127256105 [Andrographis paniculata]XP_051137896.1 uncharacterized protein LOC127256105 [Andrographis paniculata]